MSTICALFTFSLYAAIYNVLFDPAKGVDWDNRCEGSNPSFSAKALQINGLQGFFLSFPHFFYLCFFFIFFFYCLRYYLQSPAVSAGLLFCAL